LSTTEAEYVSLCDASKQARWFRNLLEEIGLDQSEWPTSVLGDNNGSIFLAHNKELNKRTKHIRVQVHYTRELVENNEINLFYVNTEDQVADTLTKALDGTKHHKFRKDLGVLSEQEALERIQEYNNKQHTI